MCREKSKWVKQMPYPSAQMDVSTGLNTLRAAELEVAAVREAEVEAVVEVEMRVFVE